jgi:hypothetical protein
MKWSKESTICYRPDWKTNKLKLYLSCNHTEELDENLVDNYFNNFDKIYNYVDLKISKKVRFEDYKKFLDTQVKRMNRGMCMLHISNNNVKEDLYDNVLWIDIVQYLVNNIHADWFLEMANKREKLSYNQVDTRLLNFYKNSSNLKYMSVRQEIYDTSEVNTLNQIIDARIDFRDKLGNIEIV